MKAIIRQKPAEKSYNLHKINITRAQIKCIYESSRPHNKVKEEAGGFLKLAGLLGEFQASERSK